MSKKRMKQLSWDILKYKYHYYTKSQPLISDYDYDMIEKEYEGLCEKYKVSPTASDMIDFNWNRPACQLVAAREEGMDLEIFNRIGYNEPRKKRKSK